MITSLQFVTPFTSINKFKIVKTERYIIPYLNIILALLSEELVLTAMNNTEKTSIKLTMNGKKITCQLSIGKAVEGNMFRQLTRHSSKESVSIKLWVP